jgi:omega-hydroxy-beta-dihydromenaquinone-9 sulfotransferase
MIIAELAGRTRRRSRRSRSLVAAVVVYALLLAVSPFPYWPSYRAVLSSVTSARSITLRQRAVLYKYLLKDMLVFPVISFFWLIDEILFRGYRKVEVTAPVFIAGEPRSGTTFLHRTLSADKNFISLKHLEWRYPLISLWKLLDLLHLRSRVEQVHYWPDTPAGRLARKMHDDRLGSFEEHGMFFEERFYHHYFVFRRYPFPELLGKITNFSHLSERERTRMMDIFKRVVQKTMYYRGRDRVWLTKENESIELYEMLGGAFHDSRFIFIVRNPDECIASYINLSKTSTMTKTGIDPLTIPGWHEANIAFRRSECAQMVEFWSRISGTNPSVAITYRQFTADIVGTVSFIYEQLGLHMSDEYAMLLRQLAAQEKARQSGYENEPYDARGFEFYSRFVTDVETCRARGNRSLAPK